ncbi:MAG: hypothetical protein FWC38_06005 [Proteobacteria bacterium]|nr:hypothetical protein [Pseudomonadota bacterium]MCL2307764.1 hypothetical protein [Pseudomonadota bacterium]
MIRNLILAAIAALAVGTAGGGWLGYRQASNACDADRWRTEAEALRVTLTWRNNVSAVDSMIARFASDKSLITEAEYAKLRQDYAALKKMRDAEKNNAPEWPRCAPIKAAATTLPDTFEGSHHAPILPPADGLPLSDDLFSLYISAYRPLLRADP